MNTAVLLLLLFAPQGRSKAAMLRAKPEERYRRAETQMRSPWDMFENVRPKQQDQQAHKRKSTNR